MFRKALVFIVFVALFVPSGVVMSTELLYLDGSSGSASSFTVGTTTFDFSLPTATLRGAQVRLQEILYYLRNLDSSSIFSTTASSDPASPSTSNIYPDIVDLVFDDSDEVTGSSNISTTADSRCHVFEGSFNVGSRGAQVIEIQRFLNRFPETRIAEIGPGSSGKETNYFGSLTFSAVFAFQTQYADAILTPVGLLNPTGYWGASTRAQANKLSLCTS